MRGGGGGLGEGGNRGGGGRRKGKGWEGRGRGRRRGEGGKGEGENGGKEGRQEAGRGGAGGWRGAGGRAKMFGDGMAGYAGFVGGGGVVHRRGEGIFCCWQKVVPHGREKSRQRGKNHFCSCCGADFFGGGRLGSVLWFFFLALRFCGLHFSWNAVSKMVGRERKKDGKEKNSLLSRNTQKKKENKKKKNGSGAGWGIKKKNRGTRRPDRNFKQRGGARFLGGGEGGGTKDPGGGKPAGTTWPRQK